MIIRNFVWQNVSDRKCSSEGKGPQKTGGQGRNKSKCPHSFWIRPWRAGASFYKLWGGGGGQFPKGPPRGLRNHA